MERVKSDVPAVIQEEDGARLGVRLQLDKEPCFEDLKKRITIVPPLDIVPRQEARDTAQR